MLPLYTRWLSVEDYGTTDIINVYVSFIISIVSCCIAESLFIFPKEQEKDKQKEYFSSAIIFGICTLLLYALFSIATRIFSYTWNWHNSFTNNIWLIYGLLAATMFQQMSQQFVRSIDQMKVYSITGIVLTLTTALFSWFFIPSLGVTGFVCALISANVVAALFSLLASNSIRFFSLESVNKKCLLEMLRYSVPLIPNGIMWWLVGAFNRPLMENSLGMYAIGIFAVANKFPSIVVLVFNIFVTSWQISVIEEFKKENFGTFYNSILKMVLVTLFFVFVLVSIFSKLLVGLFASSDFMEAWQYVPVLSLGCVMQCLSGFFGTVFSAVRVSKYFFYSSIWGALIAIILNFKLIPLFGIMGAAIATLLSFAGMALSRLYYSWQFVKVSDKLQILFSLLLFLCVPILLLGIDTCKASIGVFAVSCLFFLNNRVFCLKVLSKIKDRL